MKLIKILITLTDEGVKSERESFMVKEYDDEYRLVGSTFTIVSKSIKKNEIGIIDIHKGVTSFYARTICEEKDIEKMEEEMIIEIGRTIEKEYRILSEKIETFNKANHKPKKIIQNY